MVFLVFVFGLIVGSFLNVVIHRLHTGESIIVKPSHCPHCRHKLTVLDLIPVVSFLFLRGRCRYCKHPISWIYPTVELITAFLFTLIYLDEYRIQNTEYSIGILNSVFGILPELVFTCFLIVIFVYDLKHYLILDKIVFPAAALALVYQIYQGNLMSALIGAALLSGFFAALYFYSRGRWIGFGDVKLGIFLGFLIPYPQTIALFLLAYIIGALVAVFLILLRKKKMADQIPFGTFLTLAAFLSLLWGGQMIEWYFDLIGF